MVKIGIAGIGHMGKMHLLNLIKIVDKKNIVVADASKNARIFAEKMGIKSIVSDYHDLDKHKVDAVIISLPNFLKFECIEYAAKNNMHIMIDKPLARNLSESKEIEKIVNKYNTRLMVASNYRYHPHVQKLYRQVKECSIGDSVLASFDLVMHGPFSHLLDPQPIPEWWFDQELNGGGALLDLGWHALDLFNWLYGDFKIEYVDFDYRFNLPLEDTVRLLIKSDTGVRGTINAGWFSHVLFPKFDFRVVVHGTMGYCSTDELKPNFYLNAARSSINNVLKRITFREVDYLSYTYFLSSFYQVLHEFVRCIESGEEFPISLEDELLVQRKISEIYEYQKIKEEYPR